MYCTLALALRFSAAEDAYPLWSKLSHPHKRHPVLNEMKMQDCDWVLPYTVSFASLHRSPNIRRPMTTSPKRAPRSKS